MPSASFTTSGSWTVPVGTTGTFTITGQAEGGNGSQPLTAHHGGFGAGGGETAQDTPAATTGTVITFTIGTGGSSTNTVITIPGWGTITAHSGSNATATAIGTGGSGSVNAVHFSGGNGGTGASGSSGTGGGGGGGGSAGTTGAGGTGGNGGTGTAGTAGTAGTGSPAGSAGGAGSNVATNPGSAGSGIGAGGGGGADNASGGSAGGAGQPGQVTITWTLATSAAPGYAAAYGTAAGTKKAIGSAAGYASAWGTAAGHKIATGHALGYARATPVPAPPPAVVNQWAPAAFYQPAAFQTSPPALQSLVCALDESTSVGGGSGTPSGGNWLFAACGWNQQAANPPVTVAVTDDIHSWWRPMPPSQGSANTRTTIWYTPNLAREAADVYQAPWGCVDGMTMTVVEVTGLGPWDTVAEYVTGYLAATESLELTMAAPAQPSFVLAAFCGDNIAAGQSMTLPSGWEALEAVSGTDGSDSTCDTYLTTAYISTTSATQSVTATATSDTDISGAMLAVYTAGTVPPIPAGQSPSWPPTYYEMAFGSGFLTPPDELVWTDISKRVWSWFERQTGVQYLLGQIQSSDVVINLNNMDGAFIPSNPGSPFYSNALNDNMSFNMTAGWARLLPQSYPGITPWTAVNGAAIAQSSAYAFASAQNAIPTYSMQVSPNGSTALPGAASEHIAVTATGTYSASAWFYSGAGWSTGAQVTIAWYTSGGTLISTTAATAVPVPAATWTQVTLLDVTTPSNAVTAVLGVRFAGTPAALPFYVAEAALVPGAAVVSTGLVATGTPVRMRQAVGTTGGVVTNRWQVWQRNAVSFPEARTGAMLGYVPMTASDIWSIIARPCLTPYRGEVVQDNPSAWWPCDDQPLSGGVLPLTLRNAAPGNDGTLLDIVASPEGVSAQDAYTTTGDNDATTTGGYSTKNPPPAVATYQVAAQSGWMYGDPQSSPSAVSTGGTVTSQPGSAAWQCSGMQGTTGSHGWFLTANDTAFPPLSGGVTVEAWFNAAFYGTDTVWYVVIDDQFVIAAQPITDLTILEIATGSEPVALLQMDTNGYLNLITYNGSTPTSNTIYDTSDLRGASWNHVAVTLTETTWQVFVNGGLTAQASGTATGMTSAWDWLILNGDLGSGGGSTLSGIVHGGNLSLSHIAVYDRVLPAYRVRAHYCAAITGMGTLPPPSGLQLQTIYGTNEDGANFVPDGSTVFGGYGLAGGDGSATEFTFSVLLASQAGDYTSGPAARSVIGGVGQTALGDFPDYGAAIWASWTALAPTVLSYTSASAATELEAGSALGSGVAFSKLYGSSTVTDGVCVTGSGTGASPPSAPSSLGDAAGSRLDRILSYGQLPCLRSIDQAPLLVQAALDVGGQAAGSNAQNIQASDDGLMFIDNLGSLCYRQRPHLAADTVAWFVGPGTVNTYGKDQQFPNDPTRAFTDVRITPYEPDGTTPPTITPSSYTAVQAAQAQIGDRPQAITSYLQSQTEMQAQANWQFQQYGCTRRRVQGMTIDAASRPSAWSFVTGCNVGDVIQVSDVPFGAPNTTGQYRISSMSRQLSGGAQGTRTTGSVTITADPVPGNYWS